MAVATKASHDKLPPLKHRNSRSSFAMKRPSEWAFTSDVPSDVVVDVDGTTFSLHKFPLVSRSGRIRKMAAEARETTDPGRLELKDVPGGPEAFELAAKFCYGVNFEITTVNVAVLRCVAEALEMTDDYGDGNLVTRTEAFLQEVVLQNLADAVAVLHQCENLLPMAEDLRIVQRCIDAAASKACREQIASSLARAGGGGGTDHNNSSGSGRSDNVQKLSFNNGNSKLSLIDWWAEDLSVLRIDLYQRVLAAMRSRGLRYESIGGALMHYAHRSLKGLNRKQTAAGAGAGTRKMKVHDSATAMEHEQRVLVETIVSLLPPEKNTASCSFLFGLLRTAIILDTTIACRLDLEKRIGMQLEQATLDDLLIPSFSYTGDTLFDVDIVHRILVNFLQQEDGDDIQDSQLMYESDSNMSSSPSQSAVMKVAKLVDSYLAEIAPDANLKLSKFVSLAELLPEYARVVDDGLYRAIDIYLKAHPALSEMERKKLCKLMDCQKLSQEACTHAAQNERLPVQVVVQVLYFEQLRLRTAMAGSFTDGEHAASQYSQRISSGALSAAISPRDNYSSVRRENRELKLEIARMRMRLTDLEKEHVNMKQDMEKSGSAQRFVSSMTKKLGKLNPFGRAPKDSASQKNPQTPDLTKRRRRHSIS